MVYLLKIFHSTGVRQGENLPLLFSLYLNDLQQFLQEAHMGLKEIRDLATETLDNKKNSINLMEEYCHSSWW